MGEKKKYTSITLLAWLLLAGVTQAQDTSSGPMLVVLDTPADFKAIGALTTVDTTAPVNGVTGPWLAVAGVNWSFQIRHVSPGYVNAAAFPPGGFNMVQLEIQGAAAGGHLVAPHGEGVNPLPGASKLVPRIRFGAKARFLSATGRARHGTHWDHYNVRSFVTALPGAPNAGGPPPPPPGPPNLLTGPAEILAAHRASSRHSFPRFGTIASSLQAGSSVSYNASTKTLSFSVGAVDLLDTVGGRSGRVHPKYSADPVLSGRWTVSDLVLEGKDADGRFRFRGGQVTVADPAGRFSIDGSFQDYFIDDTTQNDPLNSFAIFDQLAIGVQGETDSPFIMDFSDLNLFGKGVSAEDWALFQGIDFTFVTSRNLVDLTDGFSKSAFAVPASVMITANTIPDEKPKPKYR